MSTAGYTILPEKSSISKPFDDNMKYINRLSYAAPVLPLSNPATDILNLPDLSMSPPRYSPTIQDDGYRVGQGGMAPKGGIYWSPPNSPKTAELQQQRQQQHKSWKLEKQGSQDSADKSMKGRRFRKLLRKLSSSGSSSEE